MSSARIVVMRCLYGTLHSMTVYVMVGLVLFPWLVEERLLWGLLMQLFVCSFHLDSKPVDDFSPLGFRNLFIAGNAKSQPQMTLDGGMCFAGGFVELIDIILDERLMRRCQCLWSQTLQD